MSSLDNRVKSFEQMESDWRKYLSLWRSKPDLFIDFILPKDSKFKLFFYQRVILRSMFRYRTSYYTLTRGSSKSFLQILAKIIECILYPSTKTMIVAPQKNMSAQISQQNIDAILEFMPILRNEIRVYKAEKDYTKLIFHNGSVLDCVANNESSRGLRRHHLSVEEIIHEKFDEESFNSVIKPILANDRMTPHGYDENELKKKQIFVTTAGTKQSFAFTVLKDTLKDMVDGKSAFILGAGYRMPTSFGLLSLEYINDMKESDSYSPLVFTREMESVWSGSSENSLVDLDTFRKSRILRDAEEKAVNDKNVEYVLSYDVSRSEGSANAQSALVVLRLDKKNDGTYSKRVVNIYTFEGSHFREQALFLKRKVEEFRSRCLVVDANGLGQGLIDFLVLPDLDTNPAYEVINDDRYKKFKTEDSIPMIFAIKSQSKETNASDIHNLFIRWVGNGQVKFLESESQAKGRIRNKDDERMAEKLRAFVMTDLLQEEIMNLEFRASGHRTDVKRISKAIQKDMFSALEYGLWYVNVLEKENKTRNEQNLGDISSFFMGRKAKLI